MSKLVDLDEVLKILPKKALSAKALTKLAALQGKPAVTYSDGWCYSEDSRYKHEEKELACLILMAYRYAVERHATQCLYRMDLHKIITDNLRIMCDDFVRQMIDGIHREMRWHNMSPEYRYPLIRIDYLLDDFMKMVGYLIKEGKIKECEKLSEIVMSVTKISREIEWLEKDLKEPIEHLKWVDNTEYLRPLLNSLQEEFERRGYKRIEE